MRILRDSLAICATIAAVGFALAQRGVVQDGPDRLEQVSTLRDAIDAAGNRPLHILEIHGIGSEGAGDSLPLQDALCSRLHDCDQKAATKTREWADQGLFDPATVPAYEYMGTPIWTTQQEWLASAPFVDHYVIPRAGGKKLIVDEINWWPIAFPIKCRNVIAPEARLAGLLSEYEGDCTRPTQLDTDGKHFAQFAWIAAPAQNKMRAASINRQLKNGIVDWNFSDAMLAAGGLHDLFVEAVRELMTNCARFNADGTKSDNWSEDKDQVFLFVTHSLGSYLALSTLDLGQEAGAGEVASTQYIFQHAPLLYFFANQIPLLELANAAAPPAAAKIMGETAVSSSKLKRQVSKWAQLRQQHQPKALPVSGCPTKPQIVAWSDPSDLLTYRVPALDDALVVNAYVQNAPHWFGLFENPTTAHANYVKNRHVLDVIMAHGACSRP